MGGCMSNHHESSLLMQELSKPENRRLILQALNLKEEVDSNKKNEPASQAVGGLTTQTAAASSPQGSVTRCGTVSKKKNECTDCHCECHKRFVDSTLSQFDLNGQMLLNQSQTTNLYNALVLKLLSSSLNDEKLRRKLNLRKKSSAKPCKGTSIKEPRIDEEEEEEHTESRDEASSASLMQNESSSECSSSLLSSVLDSATHVTHRPNQILVCDNRGRQQEDVRHGKRAHSHLPRPHSSYVHILNMSSTQPDSRFFQRSNRYHYDPDKHPHYQQKQQHNEHVKERALKTYKNKPAETHRANRASNQRVSNEPFCELHNPINLIKKSTKNRTESKQSRGKKEASYEFEEDDDNSERNSNDLLGTQQEIVDFKHLLNSHKSNRASSSLGLLANLDLESDSRVYPNEKVQTDKEHKANNFPHNHERQTRHQRSLSVNPYDNSVNGFSNDAKSHLSQVIAHERSYNMTDRQKIVQPQPFSMFSQLKVSNVDMPCPVYPRANSFLNFVEHKDELNRNDEEEKMSENLNEHEMEEKEEEQAHSLEELDDEGNYYLLKKRHSSKSSTRPAIQNVHSPIFRVKTMHSNEKSANKSKEEKPKTVGFVIDCAQEKCNEANDSILVDVEKIKSRLLDRVSSNQQSGRVMKRLSSQVDQRMREIQQDQAGEEIEEEEIKTIDSFQLASKSSSILQSTIQKTTTTTTTTVETKKTQQQNRMASSPSEKLNKESAVESAKVPSRFADISIFKADSFSSLSFVDDALPHENSNRPISVLARSNMIGPVQLPIRKCSQVNSNEFEKQFEETLEPPIQSVNEPEKVRESVEFSNENPLCLSMSNSINLCNLLVPCEKTSKQTNASMNQSSISSLDFYAGEEIESCKSVDTNLAYNLNDEEEEDETSSSCDSDSDFEQSLEMVFNSSSYKTKMKQFNDCSSVLITAEEDDDEDQKCDHERKTLNIIQEMSHESSQVSFDSTEREAKRKETRTNSNDSQSISSKSASEKNEKLKLQSIVEAVGFILFPSAELVNLAFKDLLIQTNLFDVFKKSFRSEVVIMFDECAKEANAESTNTLRFAPFCESLLNKILKHLLRLNKIKQKKSNLKNLQKHLGSLYFKRLVDEFEKPLRSLAGSMQSFYNNLNSLHEALLLHEHFGSRFLFLHESLAGYSPSFRTEISKREGDSTSLKHTSPFQLNIFTVQERSSSFINNFYCGLIQASARLLWGLSVRVEKIRNIEVLLSLKAKHNKQIQLEELKESPFVMGYVVQCADSSFNHSTLLVHKEIDELRARLNDEDEDKEDVYGADCFISGENLSDEPNDLLISVEAFKSTFPFTILLDRSMLIKQFGDGLVKYLGPAVLMSGLGTNFFNYFSIESPKLNEYTFNSLMLNQNMNFKLKMKSVANENERVLISKQFKDMELKGSMIYLEESDHLLFIGSPVIQHLEELTGRGLYISDIPIHDATRDIILVGEQTKAQEGLKFRMEKLKKSIVKAHEDIDEEKTKNIELLNLIFPSDIAQKLWCGERVKARSVHNVTLLYSDIVGFTSICSTAQPIEIIEMLKRLYTDFDNFCGLLDIYKIETIGDAYVVAGGLHKHNEFHAQLIAWMSLLMMQSAARNYTHRGDPIKMRVGIHTGDVLAGIVGIKQPRYCLFGHTCTVANKFESMSEDKRIHVSPVTKRYLEQNTEKIRGCFGLEPRSAQFLPENWSSTSSSSNEQEANEISWFLNSFKHESIREDGCESKDVIEHVQAALNQINLTS